MTAGRAERVHRDQHARARNLAVADGVAQADVDVVARAHVAHGGEAGHQRLAHDIDGVQRALRDGLLQPVQLLLAVVALEGVGEVRVRVDEARQQRRVAEVDGLRAGGDGGVRTHADDLAVGYHYDQPGRDDVVALAVEHARGFEHVGLVGGERGKGTGQ